jgi:hypothetical protein
VYRDRHPWTSSPFSTAHTRYPPPSPSTRDSYGCPRTLCAGERPDGGCRRSTAIGIENVGLSDAQILGDRAQIAASLRLTRWLRCTYGIALKNVIGHNESLSSPFHRERVAAFAHQTHSDFDHADMHVYRTRLARLPCPAGSFGGSAQPGTGGN